MPYSEGMGGVAWQMAYFNADDLRGADFSGSIGKGLRFNLGYFFNPHIYSGINFGAERYEIAAANTFPLTYNMRYYLKDQRNTFYSFVEGGPDLK